METFKTTKKVTIYKLLLNELAKKQITEKKHISKKRHASQMSLETFLLIRIHFSIHILNNNNEKFISISMDFLYLLRSPCWALPQ